MSDLSVYVFATCHPGCEPWLKSDVHRQHPGYRVSFSRPGFVTWRVDTPLTLPWRTPLSIFAHAFGVCWGQVSKREEPVDWAAQLSAQHRRLHLHAWERAPDVAPAGSLTALDASLREALPSAFLASDDRVLPGDGVLDLIAVDADVYWAGWHVHTRAHAPHAGGHWPVTTPAEAPSRAYTKIATTLAWANVPLQAGECALELGAAPGGACYALLERGLDVWGCDPAAMSPTVSALAFSRGQRFVHVQKPAGELRQRDLPRRVHWLVSDMNLAAPVAWRYVHRLLPWVSRDLRGIVLTLKLNDNAALEKLPELIDDIRTAGFSELRVASLPPYRREVVLVAVTSERAVTRAAHAAAVSARSRGMGVSSGV